MIVKTNITASSGMNIVKRFLKSSLLPFLILMSSSLYAQLGEIDISNEKIKDAIAEELLLEIDNLERNLKFISNTTNDMASVEIQIAMALKKFQSKSSIVQVSSLRDTSVRDDVEVYTYLYHLSRLRKKYEEIHIDFNRKEVGDIIPLGDNRFRAKGLFVQAFIGVNNEAIAYGDETEKSIDFEVYPTTNSDGTWQMNIRIIRIDVNSTKELSNFYKNQF